MKEAIHIMVELGFTPMNVVMAVGVIVLWGWSKSKDTKQTKTREAWHDETRAQVAELKTHTETCEQDRKQLSGRVEELSRRVEDVGRCPRKDCPMRKG